ncbi:MAG: transpeptidase family protein [Leptospiraceae bacterium]|nr:transpeptidase family protein [Leptospiraceae bacterium]
MERSRNRLGFLVALFLLGFVILMGRIAYLTFDKADGGNDDSSHVLRGQILDRRGFTLARTSEASIIALAPPEIEDAEYLANLLGQRLLLQPSTILDRIDANRRRERKYFYLKRNVDNLLADQIMTMQLPGVYREREDHREYPSETLASNLLGFVGRDQGEALEGIERDYNDILTQPDPAQTHSGLSLQLTIDALMQYRLEQELGAAFEAAHSKRAAGIIMNIHTGEILAMAAFPNFDPNEYYRSTAYQRGNWNIRLNYEPGSTVKVFMAAILLAEGAVNPGEKFHCDGIIHFRDTTVACRYHGQIHAHGDLTLPQIIQRSCNVGIIKAMQRVSRDRFYYYMDRLGFGHKTGVLPGGSGETQGYFPALENWVPSTSYYMPIGQGFSVTPIQLLRAGSSLANGGELVRPHIADRVISSNGRSINQAQTFSEPNPFSAGVNRDVLSMMRLVVQSGTGVAAQVPGVSVAGKTGTGEKSSARGYLDKYVVSFMGFFPADRPRYGMLILFDEGEGNISGGSVAAPVFSRVVEHILPYINDNTESIRPGRLEPLKVRPPEVNPDVLYDFRGMAARDALQVISSYYGVPVELEGSGYVYAQAPPPGSDMSKVSKIVLYLDALR